MGDHVTHSTGPEGQTVGTPAGPANPPGYELLDELGRGGMGIVYRARDTALGRDVAVKLLTDRYAPDSPAAQRFLNEARITGQLQHPGIPAVHQVGTCPDGRPFLAMKLIKGSTLEAILKDRHDSTTARGQLVAVFEAVCQAVGYAHAHRVIHRDLKPANVMVGAFGEVQVMDWGLAKVLGEEAPAAASPEAAEQTRAWTQVSPTPDSASYTQAGSLVGTPAFIPPEQAAGELGKVDERADVFGLGGLLTVILTGRPPYVGENFESVRVLAVRGKLDDCFARLDACGAEPELVALCKRCLAFEPADRPRHGGEAAAAVAGLRAAAEERARTAEREKAAADARAVEQRRKRRWQYAAVGVVVLALAGGVLGLGVYLRAQSQANADLAAKNAELAAAADRERQRFNLAVDAIGLFTGDVSQDVLLKEKEFEGLRTKLLEGATDFYGKLEAQLKDQDDPASRAALGRAYYDLGNLMDRLGKLPQAIQAYRKALAVRRELADRLGAGPETHLDVGRTHAALVLPLVFTRDHDGAAAAGREALEAAAKAETLAGPSPASAEVRGDTHFALARLLLMQTRSVEAREETRRGIAARQTVVDARPNDPIALGKLSRIYNALAVITREQSSSTALKYLRTATALAARSVKADPNNPDHKLHLSMYRMNVAANYVAGDRLPDALAESDHALRTVRELVAAFPSVKEFQRVLSFTLYIRGMALLFLDRTEQAEATFREQISLCTALAATGYRADEVNGTKAAALHLLASHELVAGRVAEAAAGYKTAIVTAEQLKGGDDYEYRHGVTPALCGLGLTEQAAGRPAEAAKLIRQAIATSEQNKQDHDLFHLGSCYAALSGLAGVKNSGVPAAEGPAHAQKAMNLLRQAVKGAFRARTLVARDPGYRVLKDREDFKKLLAQMETLNQAEAAKDK